MPNIDSLQNKQFSLPLTLISSMLENPSSHNGLLKLYQTCKYFFSKHPILIADRVGITSFPDEHGNQQWDIAAGYKDITHLQVPIWPIDIVDIQECDGSKKQIPKLFRYSIKNLQLFNISLQYEDFVLLTSEKSIIFATICTSKILHSNSTSVCIDEILRHLPNIQYLTYFIDETCSAAILENLNKVKLNSILKYIFLDIMKLHSTFDFNLFCEFIAKNTNAETRIHIVISNEESRDTLKTTLENLNPSWRKAGYDNSLKQMFQQIDPDWHDVEN